VATNRNSQVNQDELKSPRQANAATSDIFDTTKMYTSIDDEMRYGAAGKQIVSANHFAWALAKCDLPNSVKVVIGFQKSVIEPVDTDDVPDSWNAMTEQARAGMKKSKIDDSQWKYVEVIVTKAKDAWVLADKDKPMSPARQSEISADDIQKLSQFLQNPKTIENIISKAMLPAYKSSLKSDDRSIQRAIDSAQEGQRVDRTHLKGELKKRAVAEKWFQPKNQLTPLKVQTEKAALKAKRANTLRVDSDASSISAASIFSPRSPQSPTSPKVASNDPVIKPETPKGS
jgi:hypothetical protein